MSFRRDEQVYLMHLPVLEASAKALLSSAVVGADWLPHLETMMTAMNAKGGGPARLSSPSFFALPTSGLREAYAKFRTGAVPPLASHSLLTVAPDEGFVADYMRVANDVRVRDPFYNDFLRSHQCLHQAAALLDVSKDGILKFQLFRGPFEPDELDAVTRMLPYLRSAAMVSRGVSMGVARERAAPFERRGEPTFRLDERGLASPLGPVAERLPAGAPVRIVAGRLAAESDDATRRIDRIVKAAIGLDGRPGSVVLTSSAGGRHQLLVLPVQGRALDVFSSTRALATLLRIAGGRDREARGRAELLLSTGFDLTPREAELAVMVADGSSPMQIANRLALGEGIVRNHVKSVFRKTQVRSQAELAALIGRYH